MFEPKLPVIAAAVGFVLSFLVGLFSGAAFPAFLFRAVAMAIFFAAVAALFILVVRKFLPELLNPGDTPLPTATPRDTGTQVDLTIGDGDDVPESPFFRAEPELEQSPDETEDLDYDEAVSSQDDVDDIPVRDVQPAPGAGSAPAGGNVPGSEPEKPAVKQKPKGGVSGLDILPDLQDFIPEEKVVEEDADDIDESIVVHSSGKGFSVPDAATDGLETETMAKAIRTILSRDN